MRDLADFVDADDPIVEDLLSATIELIGEAGGWINPQARLVSREGQLSLECDDESGPLVRVPRGAMVRVDQVAWADDPERLTIADVPDDIGDVELQMLYTQVALHNQCAKVPWLQHTHPALAELPEDLVYAVRSIIPSFRAQPISPTDVLFATRCFRVDLGDGDGPQRLLIPVVDLLNHHRGGSVGDWDGSHFDVTVSRSFGTAECTLDYGLDRDALEMAVVYGFVDESATVAHSAPVAFDVPSAGPIRISFREGDRAATISELSETTGWDASQCTSALPVLLEENLALVSDVVAACTGVESDASAILGAAATRHASILSSLTE